MKALLVFGTRPEIIKLSPIIWASRHFQDFEFTLVHTGQHYDYLMSDIFINDLEIPQPAYRFNICTGSPTDQIAKIMSEVERVAETEKPDIILIQGDTNTVPATCMVARRMLIPVGHVEAGLRSFNEKSPEEVNRKIASTLALYHFAPTWLNFYFLTFEGVPPSRVSVTGNTIVDVFEKVRHKIEASNIIERLNLKLDERFILLTTHRPENVDKYENLRKIIEALAALKDYKIIFPIHPRTRKRLEEFNLLHRVVSLLHVEIVDPLPYLDFLRLLSSSTLVITDSGGVQEEAAILKKPTLTLRNTTPRWETVFSKINLLVSVNPKLIVEAAQFYFERSDIFKRMVETFNIYGDGTAGGKIVRSVLDLWNRGLLKYSETKPPNLFPRKF